MAKKLVRVGIADAHGIEYYVDPKAIGKGSLSQDMMLMRATLNRQRHAVCYQVTLNEESDAAVTKKIKARDFIGALKVLKKKAITIGFPERYASYFKNSWKLIPNPKLDPWR